MKKRVAFIVVVFWALMISSYFREVQSCETSPPAPGYTITSAPSQIFLGVILVEFSDIKHRDDPPTYPPYIKTQFERMFFSEAYYETDLSLPEEEQVRSPDGEQVFGSMHDFWDEMSYGAFDLSGAVLNDTLPSGEPIWISLPEMQSYYIYCPEGGEGCDSIRTGGQCEDCPPCNCDTCYRIFIDTVLAAATDSNLNVDACDKIVIVYSGTRKFCGLTIKANALNGNVYLMCERYGGFFSHIGIHCHEFGHLLGLPHVPGFYVPPKGSWALMGLGHQNGPLYSGESEPRGSCPASINPDYRVKLGWASIDAEHQIESDTYGEEIEYSLNGFDIYRKSLRDTTIDGTLYEEYFLIENRQTTDGFNRYLPGQSNGGGLLIWHKAYNIPHEDSIVVYLDLEESDGSDLDESKDPFVDKSFNLHNS